MPGARGLRRRGAGGRGGTATSFGRRARRGDKAGLQDPAARKARTRPRRRWRKGRHPGDFFGHRGAGRSHPRREGNVRNRGGHRNDHGRGLPRGLRRRERCRFGLPPEPPTLVRRRRHRPHRLRRPRRGRARRTRIPRPRGRTRTRGRPSFGRGRAARGAEGDIGRRQHDHAAPFRRRRSLPHRGGALHARIHGTPPIRRPGLRPALRPGGTPARSFGRGLRGSRYRRRHTRYEPRGQNGADPPSGSGYQRGDGPRRPRGSGRLRHSRRPCLRGRGHILRHWRRGRGGGLAVLGGRRP